MIWHQSLTMARAPPFPPSMEWEAVMENQPEADRVLGTLLGGAIGDALGRPAEGRPREVVRARYRRLNEYRPRRGSSGEPLGIITDDTQLTVCVGECLSLHGYLNPEDLARRFVSWLDYKVNAGHATVTAVERLKRGDPWTRSAPS
jgi:ADP-ribosylglycohydrolase